jgi:hypothetical protein
MMDDWESKSLKAMQAEERVRVAAMIKRDRDERAREASRQLAEIEVARGLYVNLSDSVAEPTPEWLVQGDHRPFTPRQPDDTVRVIKTVRRVTTPVVARMYIAGRLGDDHFAACMWYRERHESAGLEGRYKTNHLSLAGNVGGSGGMGQAPIAQHAWEARARQEFRGARSAVEPFYLKFFEAVVIYDIPARRAARFARCHHSKVRRRLADCAERVLRWAALNQIEIGGGDG